MEENKKKKIITITIIVLSVLLAVALICLVIVLASGKHTATSTVPDNILSTEDSEDSSKTKLVFDSDNSTRSEKVQISDATPGYERILNYTLNLYHTEDVTVSFLMNTIKAEGAEESALEKALMVKVDLLDLDTTTIYYDTLYAMKESLPIRLSSEEETITRVEFRVTVFLDEGARDLYSKEVLDLSLDWTVENPEGLTLPDDELADMEPAEDGSVPIWLVVVLSICAGMAVIGITVLVVYLVKKQREARRADLE